MNTKERQARAFRRATPHLEVATARIVDLGIPPIDAAQAMLLFAAGRMINEMSEDQVTAEILRARDAVHSWFTEIAIQAGKVVREKTNG